MSSGLARWQQLSPAAPTITFVLPWYGPQISGGAEYQARRMAEELAARGVAVEVFSTTAGGLASDWNAPAFSVGADSVHSVPVQRFAVRPRNAARFDQLNARVLAGELLTLPEEAVFVREIIGSDTLEQAIAAERTRRLYIFTPYMFGTSYWGARRTAGRSYLIPCLHDEPYAKLLLYRELIEHAYALMYYAPAEARLARRRFSIPHQRTLVLGGGIDTHLHGNAARFRAAWQLGEQPFLLYAGRRDAGKNTPLLLEYFRRYRQEGGQLRLVAIGGPGAPLPADLIASGAALETGFLDEQAKFDAYAAADLLCQPSLHESFSIVMMEAWHNHTPVLVHSDCAVTSEFAELSGGGLHFRTYAEFAACVHWLQQHPRTTAQMGQSGAAYVQRNFTWAAVLERLLGFLAATHTRFALPAVLQPREPAA
ncbi:MAG: glycosyltransferase family 4 protein [Chloroflexaceae bacterium]|nr:glycosyltransferase family 4 protein [Chloroflexaceae bacterium]